MLLIKGIKSKVGLIILIIWLSLCVSNLFHYSFTFSKLSYKLASFSIDSYQVGNLVICNDFEGIVVPYKSYLFDTKHYKANRDRNILMFFDWVLMPSKEPLMYIANKEGDYISFLQTSVQADNKGEALKIIDNIVSELGGEQINLKGVDATLVKNEEHYIYTLPMEGVVITATVPSMVDTLNFASKENYACHQNLNGQDN